jgi:hypothetical protein
MPTLTILYWRDIPAQVIAREGRTAAKRELAPRFAEAIDRAAMRTGAKDSEAYLAEWRRGDPSPCGDDLAAEAARLAAEIERSLDDERLQALVAAGGHATRS